MNILYFQLFANTKGMNHLKTDKHKRTWQKITSISIFSDADDASVHTVVQENLWVRGPQNERILKYIVVTFRLGTVLLKTVFRQI